MNFKDRIKKLEKAILNAKEDISLMNMKKIAENMFPQVDWDAFIKKNNVTSSREIYLESLKLLGEDI